MFALLGDPVDHSVSPAMHNAAFRALGLDAVYVALQVAEDRLPVMMDGLATAGGGGNVTSPHKAAAARALDPADPGSDRRSTNLESCNTFWGAAGHLVGASTDGIGMLHAFDILGRPGGDWLVIGTGGSAVTAVAAAATAGARVVVQSRDAARARRLEADAVRSGATLGGDGPIGLVLNCTPLGLGSADPAPLGVAGWPPGAVALDLVYRPGYTGWVRALRAAGIRAIDGREVLVAQGAASFELWFPKLKAPVEVMRAAVNDALR